MELLQQQEHRQQPQQQRVFKYLIFFTLRKDKQREKIRKKRYEEINLSSNLSSNAKLVVVQCTYVCPMNFFYVFIVPGPMLRHLGEFGKIRLLPGENTCFLPEDVSMGI
jgi:hypothetical protein